MPNHVTNKITASPEVIKSMINEAGYIDFALVIPFAGTFDWDFVDCTAETFAEAVVGQPVDDHPLIGRLQAVNRDRATFDSVAKGSDERFEQFIQMLRNYRACGFLHNMDFARQAWGTKWNAYDQTIAEDRSSAQFDTAWSAPMPVYVALSKKFPSERIAVTFADEDIGSNCGTFTLLNGEMVEQDIAPCWSLQSEEEQKKWTAFAYQVKGWEPEEEDAA
ncbi:hypothetical protein JYK21_29590 [Ralstonia pickettii]|nr:hypothetical protein [Ralstonia pickettii]